ncbi:MAG TPA: class I SAM-dependent rRNA methyltransferase [Polyangia bacterium]|nr:class I SAM-dependent rRNA methyltransferase [Polyangia bacterium]
MSSTGNVVTVSARGAARLRGGHPWVYAEDVARQDARGDVVRVVDGRGATLGTALWAPGARLPLRLFARDEVTLDAALVEKRVRAADELRRRMMPGADAYRVVHAEADGLPGLVVDRYADVCVLQTTARAMDAREAEIADVVARVCDARLVVARDDSSARDFEGLPRRRGVVRGEGTTRVQYHDAGSVFEVDVLADGKTGGFLDQAENHARAATYVPAGAEALDAFTYHGGFALALARGGAASVLALDEAALAAERARENAARNGLSQVKVEQANAFDRLRALEGDGRSFDVVVIDPPALAKRKSAFGAADRAYKELNLRALRLTRPGGIVVTCSCSGKLSPEGFGAIVAEAARDAGKTVQLIERRGAGRDHPPLLGVLETEYLKCWILRVLA